MNSIHVEAYTETIIDILQTKDLKESVVATLKKVGVVTGGMLVGGVAMGPLGLAIGGGIAGGAISEMQQNDKNVEDMTMYLRGLEFKDKSALVRQLEELVGDSDTEELVKFCKTKPERERFVCTVCDFLLDKTPLDAQEVHPSRRPPVPLVKPANYTQLLDFGEDD